jgi:molybdopterin/thiamine biosynthesis adenylyltransferase
MRRIITFTKKDFEKAYNHLLQGREEEAAFFLAGISKTEETLNLLVREVILVPTSGFLEKGYAYLKINPDFMMPIIKRARLEKFSVISAHSHPFSNSHVAFSSIDDYGDDMLMPKIQQRVPDRPHAVMVFGKSSIDARIWEVEEKEPKPVDLIKVIGQPLQKIFPTNAPHPNKTRLSDVHHRQILAFGKIGQKRIQETKVAIVGLGGTGSQVFQQLVHLGVRNFILVDDDYVEESNRSRMVGSRPKDSIKRRMKVEVMERLGREINPNIKIYALKDSVNNLSTALKLRDVDVIFCCTDNLSSRLVLNRLAFQYLIPLIDLGISIECLEEGEIRTAGGHVLIILPDGPCLSCMGILTPEALQRETDQGYISGQTIPDPSVISLNGVIASLAVTEFIDLLTDFEKRKEECTYQVYDILKGEVRREKMDYFYPCDICKEVKGAGDDLELPCKIDKNIVVENAQR